MSPAALIIPPAAACLVPILTASAEFPVPDWFTASMRESHFAQRAAERGVRSVSGAALLWLAEAALAAGRGDLIELVWPICPESAAYRVLLPEGPYYPVLRGGRGVTIYGPRQMRETRAARRLRKRFTGKRLRT